MTDGCRVLTCPHCRSNLIDDARRCRAILIEIRGVYDGALLWQCPDCEFRWHRWPAGHYLRQRAHKYLREHNVKLTEGDDCGARR